MSSKVKNAGKAKKSKGETKGEDVLQAVILADSFQSRFKPLTLDRPRCLLPLANTPLIDYTLEFLAMNGVQEVYIYCGNHVDQVEEYIAKSRWSPNAIASPFTTFTFVPFPDARSTGDILRDLDKRGYIDGDFILVHGDVISNLSLAKVLARHKTRRTENSANIMTIVLRATGPVRHRTQAPGLTPVFTIDSKTGRCLTYDELTDSMDESKLLMDYDLLGELSSDYEVRSDLIDPEIDICTPDVLALWSESFDYELPRKNFLQGVLKDWELNGKAIYAEILEHGYAARARNLPMYNAISDDIMGRWTFPFVPDCNLFPGQKYEADFSSGNIVQGGKDGPQINATAKVIRSVLADNTIVGSDSKVSNSIVGRNCIIGRGAVIENSHIWDNSIIEDGTVIIRSLVAGQGVKISAGTVINEGSVVSFGASIGPNGNVPKDSLIAIRKYCNTASDPNILGANSNAALYQDPEDEDLDERDPTLLLKTLVYRPRSMSVASISTINSHDFSDYDSDEDDGVFDNDDADSPDGDNHADSAFHGDAVQGLLDTMRGEGGDFDAAKLEFMGLRLSQNASDVAVRRAIATAFASRASEVMESQNLDATKAVQNTLAGRPGALKFLVDVGVGAGGEDDQKEFTLSLQKAIASLKNLETSEGGVLLLAFLQQLYDLDVIEEDAVLAWWGDERGQAEDVVGVREKVKVFVEWLQTADEEDSEEDSEEEEEESDEE